MKSLHDYYIQEKLKLNKDIEVIDQEIISVKFPRYDGQWHDEVWKTVKIPYKKWIIYIDKYHSDLLHFSCLGDFLFCITIWEDDYEDSNVFDEILYASDNLKDAFKWYTNELIKRNILKRTGNGFEKSLSRKGHGCYDSDEFFNSVNDGTWGEKDLMMNTNMPTKKELENFEDWIKSIF